MQAAVTTRLKDLRADFEAVTGRPFEHFYCPILFRDEEAELCKGHIVNEVFGGPKRWTVQRKDVDNFYGSNFESDFVDLRYKAVPGEEAILDRELSKRLRPRVSVDDRRVEAYLPKGEVPSNHSLFLMPGKGGPMRLALKMHPDETLSRADGNWRIDTDRDLRLPALVSLMKAAHLTMFDMLGYRYALSAGGLLLGRDILGAFYEQNVTLRRRVVVGRAALFFLEWKHMVRPVHKEQETFRGTAIDRRVHLCRRGELVWGAVVFVHAAQTLHAVLAPVFDDAAGAALYIGFLHSSYEQIRAYLTHFDGEAWRVSKTPAQIVWPKDGELLS